MNYRLIERATVIFTTSATLAVVGCAAQDPAAVQSSRQAITLSELEQQLGQGATRVEIELGSGLEVSEIAAHPASSLSDEEHIESTIVAVDPAGSITLDLGGLTVSFDDSSRFRLPEDSNASRDAWIGVVSDTLASGGVAFVRVARLAPASPQAPSDPTFYASDLRLASEADASKLEINVAQDALAVSSESEATITVLGLALHISSSTDLYDDDGSAEAESEEGVESESGDDSSSDGGGSSDDGTPDQGSGGADDSPSDG